MKSLVAAEAATGMKSRLVSTLDWRRLEPSVLLVAAWSTLVFVAAVGGVAATQLGGDETPTAAIRADRPVSVSPRELADFAASHDSTVYWAGGLRSRRLELTMTRDATFVRYLPVGVRAGDPRAQFTTIATYRLDDAYATAVERRSKPRMASRRMPDGGLAVWNRNRPTSVYVAYRGVPHLVEVYDDRARDALKLALSGRLRPVR